MGVKSDNANPIQETSQFVASFKELTELMGLNKKPDSTEEMTKLVTLYNSLKEIFEGNRPQAPVGASTGGWVLNQQTGQLTQWQPGQPPVVNIQQPQTQQYPYIPIQVDEQGNPRVPPDFSTWLRLEEWKVDQQRKQEKHDAQMDIIQGVKDLASKATAAFSRMAEKK
jgi:hypothetical protein